MHCKRTDEPDFETDSTQIEMMNTESLHNEDDFLTETPSKKKKRRKTIKPKSCKLRNCNFVTTEGLDVMEAKKELWKHLRENHKYPLVCRLCPFVTEPKHHMVYHWLGDHTKLRPFKCEISNCSYSCVAKSMLNSHMVRHWNVYQYNCKECNFKARLLHAMKKHMREKNHSRVLILNEDGTQNLKTIIDIYSNKRGPRRKIPAKNQDKLDQIDLNQSSSSVPSPEHQDLVSHSEPQPQQQLQSVESDSNINHNNNQSNLIYSSLFQTLYNLSNIISDAILHWNNDNENTAAWHYLVCMFHHLFGNDVTAYCNREHTNRLERLFTMRKIVDVNINDLRRSYNMIHDNPETSNNNEAGPSNENANDIDRPSTFNGLTYQSKIQDILVKDYVKTMLRLCFEIDTSKAGPSDDKKDRVSTSNKRKIESERLDDMATTGNNFHLTNNEADTSNKIPNTTSERLESELQKDMIPNKPLSINKFKITGATKRKGKTQTRFVVEKNTERNKTESFESPMYSEYGLQRESQVNLITDDENSNCEHCDLIFGNKLMHVMHMHFHKINDPFTCNACGERCTDSLTFNSHLISAKH